MSNKLIPDLAISNAETHPHRFILVNQDEVTINKQKTEARSQCCEFVAIVERMVLVIAQIRAAVLSAIVGCRPIPKNGFGSRQRGFELTSDLVPT